MREENKTRIYKTEKRPEKGEEIQKKREDKREERRENTHIFAWPARTAWHCCSLIRRYSTKWKSVLCDWVAYGSR